MLKYLRIHFVYVLSIINIAIISSTFIIGLGLFLLFMYNNRMFNSIFYIDEMNEMYLGNLFMFVKLFVLTVFCFLWGSAFNEKENDYHYLITNYNKRKIYFFFSKVLLLQGISLIIVYLLFLEFNLNGILDTTWYCFNKNILNVFISIYLFCGVYCFISSILSIFIRSNYAFLISNGLYIFGEIMRESGSNIKFERIYSMFLPSIDLSYKYVSYYGIGHLLILYFLYFMIMFCAYLFMHRGEVRK